MSGPRHINPNRLSMRLLNGIGGSVILNDCFVGLRNCYKLASKFLGRPWFIQGKVIKGDKRGRTIGIPTANISLDGYISPKYGVYAVNVEIIKKKQSGKLLKGIANFGVRPTFNKKKAILEVYLFDFDLNIYQSTLKVTFIDFIRKEKKFSGIKSLKQQLNKDISKATRILI